MRGDRELDFFLFLSNQWSVTRLLRVPCIVLAILNIGTDEHHWTRLEFSANLVIATVRSSRCVALRFSIGTTERGRKDIIYLFHRFSRDRDHWLSRILCSCRGLHEFLNGRASVRFPSNISFAQLLPGLAGSSMFSSSTAWVISKIPLRFRRTLTLIFEGDPSGCG